MKLTIFVDMAAVPVEVRLGEAVALTEECQRRYAGTQITFLGRQPECERHCPGEPHAPCWKVERLPG